jgi:hypothetical protein
MTTMVAIIPINKLFLFLEGGAALVGGSDAGSDGGIFSSGCI